MAVEKTLYEYATRPKIMTKAAFVFLEEAFKEIGGIVKEGERVYVDGTKKAVFEIHYPQNVAQAACVVEDEGRSSEEIDLTRWWNDKAEEILRRYRYAFSPYM